MQGVMHWRPAITTLVTAILMLATAAILQAKESSTQLSQQDKQFITEAAQGGIAEVKMSLIALHQGQAESVKRVAKHIYKDHKTANKELLTIARQIGVQPPKQTDQQHQKLIAQLSKMDATLVDQTYLSEQIKGHKETISLFKKQAQQGKNKLVTQFARDTLPTLEEHLAMVQKLASAKAPKQ